MKQRLGHILTIVFVIAMIMGVGPGVQLVNRPESVMGLPLLYVWGLLWYVVHIVIVTTAYLYLWRRD